MILQILQRTPLWVFAVFVVLLAAGIVQSRDRRMSRPRVAILPFVLICLSLFGVWSAFGESTAAFAAWLAAVGAALLLNRRLKWPAGVIYDASGRSFSVRGSWVPLALMMGIFFARYAVAVTLAMHPELRASTLTEAVAGFGYGLMSGAFPARARRILQSAASR